MMETVAMELQDASLRSGDRYRLHPTSLRFGAGTITAVIGRNGSGKSTMLSLMSAEIRPTHGIVRIDGHDIHRMSHIERARRRAILTQDTTVSFPFTVQEVVAWGRTPWQRTPQAAEDARIVSECITSQGLAELADRPVTSLSGGERKRVHIARVLAQSTPLLLLDEADSDLDIVGRQHLDDVVLDHASRGHTVVVVSHDVTRLARISDQFILMREGRVHAMGAREDVLTQDLLSSGFDADVTVTGDGAWISVQISQTDGPR